MVINKTFSLPMKVGERLMKLVSRHMTKKEGSDGQRFTYRKGSFAVTLWFEYPAKADGNGQKD